MDSNINRFLVVLLILLSDMNLWCHLILKKEKKEKKGLLWCLMHFFASCEREIELNACR